MTALHLPLLVTAHLSYFIVIDPSKLFKRKPFLDKLYTKDDSWLNHASPCLDLEVVCLLKGLSGIPQISFA